MASIVVHNASGTVFTNGLELPVDCSRGLATPVTISGDGEIYISINPDPNISEAVYDDDGNLVTAAVPAPPVSVTVSDAMGHVTIIHQNTRYPEEGNFPLLHDPLVVT